uniref:Pentatricopeptide repeat-containing protein, mitochondrial n=1 Tax=Noccaea caerulescens TaxID=107243 RepID=A0A1J3K134_NOCCA
MNVAYRLQCTMNSLDLEPGRLAFTATINGVCKQGKAGVACAVSGLMLIKGRNLDEVSGTAFIDGFCEQCEVKTRDALFILKPLVKMRILISARSLCVLVDEYDRVQ